MVSALDSGASGPEYPQKPYLEGGKSFKSMTRKR